MQCYPAAQVEQEPLSLCDARLRSDKEVSSDSRWDTTLV